MKVLALIIAVIFGFFALENARLERDSFSVSNMTSDDRSLALGFFRGLASAIEYDGKKSSPTMSTDMDLINLRKRALDFTLTGGSFESKYRGFGEHVANQLDKALGTDGKTLDPARRDKWVKTYEEIATEFEGGF